jgi:serine protease
MRKYSFSLLLLAFFTVTSTLLAQYTKKKGVEISHSVNSNNASIVPGMLIVKLKPEYRHYSNNLSALLKHPLLSEHFKKHRVQKFEKLFPHSKTPAEGLNKYHKKRTDISLMHAIVFNPETPVTEMIKTLMASGLVEYAEPQYIEGLMYLPNDPLSQPDSIGYLQLERINAYKAWDIEKGDPNVVIGVIDTGTELTHPDLINNVKYNTADPIDGLDNDGDGYTDNYHGWDLGMNDNDPTWQVNTHGIRVQGACSATPENNFGIAGTGFNCKCIPIKITNSSGSLTVPYQGIIYAADHGVKVMNVSWGGYGAYSQASQDIVNYAALDNDVLVVAAGGNSEGELDFYPASYDNVLSATGLDTIYSPALDTIVEIRKTFPLFPGAGMSYSFNVDVASIETGFSTNSGGVINAFGASSFCSPTAAGAGALVRSRYPLLSGLQVAQLLRVTGVILDTFDVTRPESRYKTGRKLDMYAALTNTTTPAVRMESYSLSSKFGTTNFFSGDTVTITSDFFNYLSPTNNLSIKMMCINGYGTMLDSISVLGNIDSLDIKNNTSDPFKIVINQNAGPGQLIELVMIMTDPATNYYDYQGFKISVNPSTLSLDTNKIKTTITSAGRIGYNTFSATEGLGVSYLNNDLLYESGFMIGTSTTKVSDCVRNTVSADDEFKPVKTVRYADPSSKDMEAISVFNDSLATSIIGVKIKQRSYEWKNTPNDKFAILEYEITNQSATTYDSIFAGIFADWDIFSYADNRADWDDQHQLAYTFCTQGGTKVAGIALLTDNAASCFSMDNSPMGGNNINPNDGFTTSEKFNTMARGVFRKQAGMSGYGNDVSQVVAARITNFAPGDSETVAFAIIAADNITELITYAQNARDKFVSIKQGPVPSAPNVTICRKDTVDITISPVTGNNFAFFTSPPPASPVHTGNSFTMTNVYAADTIYIANSDSLFYSALKPVYIQKDNMTLDFYPNADTTSIPKGGNLLLVNQSTGTSSISWDFGDGNTATGSSASHVYNTKGFYDIKLIAVSPMSCNDTLTRVLKVGNVTDVEESLNGAELEFYPNPVSSALIVDFSNNTPPENLSIEVMNNLGITLYQSSIKTKNTMVDVSGYPAGIYYIKLKSGDAVVCKRIVKY